jgi:hypothetical protein
MLLRLLSLITIGSSLALAQAPEAASEPVKPSVKKLDDTRYQIGDVTFDQKSREIRFPAEVGAPDRTLEFLVVHENGKTYESLLSTKISATHLSLAFSLLRYPQSRELYPLPNGTGGVTDKFPEVAADVKASARINIDVEWTADGKIHRVPANDWVQHSVKTTAMPAGPWVYGGSEFFNGKYVPEMTGDIIGILVAPSALINYPGKDNDNGNIWTTFAKRIPTAGTPVTVILTPAQYTQPLAKP